MSKDKLIEQIYQENIWNQTSSFLDVDSLLKDNLLTSINDVSGVLIQELPTQKHRIIFLYKSDMFDGDQIILESYIHPINKTL